VLCQALRSSKPLSLTGRTSWRVWGTQARSTRFWACKHASGLVTRWHQKSCQRTTQHRVRRPDYCDGMTSCGPCRSSRRDASSSHLSGVILRFQGSTWPTTGGKSAQMRDIFILLGRLMGDFLICILQSAYCGTSCCFRMLSFNPSAVVQIKHSVDHCQGRCVLSSHASQRAPAGHVTCHAFLLLPSQETRWTRSASLRRCPPAPRRCSCSWRGPRGSLRVTRSPSHTEANGPMKRSCCCSVSPQMAILLTG